MSLWKCRSPYNCWTVTNSIYYINILILPQWKICCVITLFSLGVRIIRTSLVFDFEWINKDLGIPNNTINWVLEIDKISMFYHVSNLSCDLCHFTSYILMYQCNVEIAFEHWSRPLSIHIIVFLTPKRRVSSNYNIYHTIV